MLTGIHFLLTWRCTNRCDHCFLHCSPDTRGAFTLEQLRAVFAEMAHIPSLEWTWFEGGEAFLHYPILLEALRMARAAGLKTGIVTNAYWATSADDAAAWLEPVRTAGADELDVSADDFHGNPDESRNAVEAARRLGIECSTISIGRGDIRYRGRAAERLTEGQPRRRCDSFRACTHEDLEQPDRVHVDSFGNVHLCQGLLMGNLWRTPLSRLVAEHDARRHPVCRLLIEGGPAALAKESGIRPGEEFVDECHCCYTARKALLERFPEHLAPRQAYGLA